MLDFKTGLYFLRDAWMNIRKEGIRRGRNYFNIWNCFDNLLGELFFQKTIKIHPNSNKSITFLPKYHSSNLSPSGDSNLTNW